MAKLATTEDNISPDKREYGWDSDAQFEITNGLCEKCRQFSQISHSLKHFYHHECFENLQRSANLGCSICKMIMERPPVSFGFPPPSSILEDAVIVYPSRDESHIISRWHVRTKDHITNLELAVQTGPQSVSYPLSITDVSSDDPLAQQMLIKRRPIARHTTAELCASFANTQLQRCRENHSGICASRFEVQMPSRVLDLEAKDIIRVITTERLLEPWVALSYCWGSDGAIFQATKTRMPTLMAGFPITSLPKTFRDVIEVVKLIGFRYIWIDALCIIQDDPQDMGFELRRMGEVYSGAVLTIAVESADSVSKGFIGERTPPVSMPVDIPYTSDLLQIEGVVQIRSRRNPRHTFDLLGLRGWTLQETVLSPRTLHIGAEQLYWSCRSYYCCEDNPDEGITMDGHLLKYTFHSQDEIYMRDLDQYDQILWRWYTLVNDYTRRSLTFDKDTFPAIAGLAELVHHEIRSDYSAGLWDDDIARGLLWRLNQNGQQPHLYRAPSWSWAALRILPSKYGIVEGRDDQDLYGLIIGCDFNRLTSDIEWFGYSIKHPVDKPPNFHIPPVEGSYLQLRCNIMPASDWPKIRGPPFCNLRDRQWTTYVPTFMTFPWVDGTYGNSEKEGPKMGQMVCDFDVPTTDRETDLDQFIDISYAWIAHTQGNGRDYFGEPTFPHDILWCLMLKKLGDNDEEFKRVGLAQIPSSDILAPLPWQVRTIKIF